MKITEDLIIASNNKHKVVEIKQILGDFFKNIYTLSDKNINVEIEENGSTFEENALIKAKYICELTGITTLSDDSGLEVEALGGAPGVYSARFAGEECDDTKNNEKLLKLLDGICQEERTAKFVSVITLIFPDGETLVARVECPGHII